MSEEKSLSPKQHKAILCLMEGLSIRDTAKRIRISERTLGRWQADPVFCAERDRIRQRVFDEAIAALASMVGVAVEKLRDILSGEIEASHGLLRAVEITLREARSTEEYQIRAAIQDLKQSVERQQA